jgi:hypothetical protein
VKIVLGVVCLALLLTAFAGCPKSLGELDKAKSLQGQGKYEQLSALAITCKAEEAGCNQVHLIKGDACFRLARHAGDNPSKRSAFDCAANELSTGIGMTTDWQAVPMDRAQTYENVCEAARLRADFGERAHYEAMLATHAGQFMSFAPEHPGANYYAARARFYTLTRPGDHCGALGALQTQVEGMMRLHAADPRYADPYRALNGTLAEELRANCGPRPK